MPREINIEAVKRILGKNSDIHTFYLRNLGKGCYVLETNIGYPGRITEVQLQDEFVNQLGYEFNEIAFTKIEVPGKIEKYKYTTPPNETELRKAAAQTVDYGDAKYLFDKLLPKVNSVSHPSHYNSGKIEVIEALEDWKLNFHRANAVKYIARAGKKDPAKEIEDLQKAVWYLNRDIELLESTKKGVDPVRPNDMVNATPDQLEMVAKGFRPS